MRRVLSGTLIGGLMLAGSVVATAPSAVADENNSVLSCESYIIDYSGFEGENNRFVLTIDDVVVFDETFGESVHEVVNFDNTVPHEITDELFIDGVSQGEGGGETTPCTDPVPVVPEIPARATDCTDPLSQIVLPTTEGITYSIDENAGVLVAVAEEPYIFAEEDSAKMWDWLVPSLPGQRVELDFSYLMPEDCGDQMQVTTLSAVCDDGIPYIEYAVEAAWASSLAISFATEDVTAETYEDHYRMRARMPLEGRTPWPSWVPQDDPQNGPDVEFLPPEDGSDWAAMWEGKRIDVYFVPSTMSPGYMEGYRYVDSALEYPCNGDTPATPGADPTADPDSPATADAGPEGDEPPMLAATGATVGGAVAFAALLVLAGGAFIWLRRRALNS